MFLNKRKLFLVISVFLVFFLLTYNDVKSEESKIISGTAKVIDGDTIKIETNKIRLFGIDAPESKQLCKKTWLSISFLSFNKEYPCGEISTNKLKRKINNKFIMCKIKNKDRYNRFIGECFKDKTNIKHESNYNKYIESIYDYNYKFDIIVIDGVVRFDCIKPALNKIKDNGIIIFDNTDWHKNSKEKLDKSDLIPIHFHGFKPLHVDSETTSCYIGRKFNKKPNSIIPMAGTIREQHSTDRTIL